MILNCPRKAYNHIIGPQKLLNPLATSQGLGHGVGDGAHMGTCIHAGLSTYYGLWGRESEPRRRLYALDNFARCWDAYFGGRPDTVRSAHRKRRGEYILSDYFTRFLHEDQAYRPVDAELSFAVEIDPQKYGYEGEYPLDYPTLLVRRPH